MLRIDRSGNTGAVERQLGGTMPPPHSGTEYLELVGDDDADHEFCGQHQATLTGAGASGAPSVPPPCNPSYYDLATEGVEAAAVVSGGVG